MICPECGGEVSPRKTKFGKIWSCCGLKSWSKNRPMVCQGTHNARKAAHRSFDTLWKTGLLKRGVAYSMLANAMGLSLDECHMALMDKETASKVPRAVRRIICDLRRVNKLRSRPRKSQLKKSKKRGMDHE